MASKYTPTSGDYGDRDLYGPRLEVSRQINSLKAHNDPECVIFGSNTFADRREQWKLKDLIGYDKRLRAMLKSTTDSTGDDTRLTCAAPIQSYCWPKMHNTSFPLLCIASQFTGKTYTHLLYTVAQSIKRIPIHETDKMIKGETCYTDETQDGQDLNDLRNYPRCLIVTSTYDLAERIVRAIDQLKMNAYELVANDCTRLRFLPPIARSVSVDQKDEKLALRCHESEILVGTPAALIKCLELRTINFARADRVVFDDIDLCLQLWNYKIQELISIYASQTESLNSNAESMKKYLTPKEKSKIRYAQILMFSRKWTELLKKFVTTLFTQRTIIFGSIAEASVYLNLRFELEFYADQNEKLTNLIRLVKFILSQNMDQSERMVRFAIVCCNDDEADELNIKLSNIIDYPIKMIGDNELSHQANQQNRRTKEPIVIITDAAIDFEVEFLSSRQSLNSITHLIHYSVPNEMIEFDRRFRLMHKKVREETPGLISTIFIEPNISSLQAKQLYDLLSRSSSTLRGTKSALRYFIGNQANSICWRWATTSLCRFEKLSKDDRFGSYCPDRHSLLPLDQSTANRWPLSGEIKITLTHIISPNEFYFWFEAHRDMSDSRWKKFRSTGSEFMRNLQPELDKLKLAGIRSVPIEQIKKGCVYAVYFHQEGRVDRVLLLDEPKHEIQHSIGDDKRAVTTSMARINVDKEYMSLVPVFKIDHGSRLDVYVENIIKLPPKLAQIEPQCHRGFHIGYKPLSNEPNWHYRTKRIFYEKVTVQNMRHVTAWLRLNRDNCFWFDYMVISRQLANIDSSEILNVQPHRELNQEGLAEAIKSEPAFLKPSIRLLTLSKWNAQKLAECAQYAFLRSDKPILDIFLLRAFDKFNLMVRQSEFNKRLIELEDQMIEDYYNGRFRRQQHFIENAYCLARVSEGKNPETNENIYTINRVKIEAIVSTEKRETPNLDMPEDDEIDTKHRYKVVCLDHGDNFILNRDDIYEAPIKYFVTLPFQAIKCQLANVNRGLLDDTKMHNKINRALIDLSRTKSNQNKIVKCRLDAAANLYLYATKDDGPQNTYHPISKILHEQGIVLHEELVTEFDRIILPEVEEENDTTKSDQAKVLITEAIQSILWDMIREELLAAGADAKFIEQKTSKNVDDYTI